MSKRRIGNLKGIDIVDGDINIVNDSEVHINKLFGLYAKDYTFCWLVMPVNTLELRDNSQKTRMAEPTMPGPGDIALVIVDLLKKQYVFSSIPKDIKIPPIIFEDGNIILTTYDTTNMSFIFSNKDITMVDVEGTHHFVGNCFPLGALRGHIIVDNKTIKFS